MGSCAKYAAALTHPFSDEAEGAQVCDEYCFPTSTTKLERTFVLSTTSTGNLDFVVQPNPICTIATQEQFVSGTTWNDVITGGIFFTRTADTSAIGTSGASGFCEQGLCSVTTLANTYTRYRVVGFGMQLECTLSSQNQQGTVYAAKMPSLDTWGNYAQGNTPKTNTVAVWNEYLAFYGLPTVDTSGYLTTQIIQLPTRFTRSVPEITLAGGVEIDGRKCAPGALDFRDGIYDATLTQQGTGLYQGLAQFPTAAGTVAGPTNILDEDFQKQGGWSVLMVRMSGLPASVPCFTLRMVMHLEGEANINTAIINNATYPPVHVGLMHAIHSHAARMPHFKSIRRHANRFGAGLNHLFGAGASQRLINGAMTGGLLM